MHLQNKKGIPSSKGYYTCKSGDTFYYHSASELAVMLLLDRAGKKWYKNTKLRIDYELDGKKRQYIPDFVIEDGKKLIIMEIKGHKCDDLDIKMEALKQYCESNSHTYTLIDYVAIKSLIDWEEVKEKHKQCLGDSKNE